MWDQGAGRVKGKRFFSRVCDDLAGAAAALTMLDKLARKPPKAPVAVLLTRAEEEGFRAFLKQQLPNFMQPSRIIWRDELPRSPNGKLDRNLLKDELSA